MSSRAARGACGGSAWLLLMLQLAAAPAESSVPTQRDTLWVDSEERVACLTHRFVFASTFRMQDEHRELVRGEDYALDADAGCFTLFGPDTTGAGRRLVAEYRALPMALQTSYRLRENPHRRLPPSPDAEVGARPEPSEFTATEESRGLAISGSKTFGIEVGNRQDLKLRQSLDLRLTGQVTRDVSLIAILSDQDIPFQPEGNTAELAELDRVLVKLEAPRAGASLGDVSLTAAGLEFLDLSRELEGFTGSAEIEGVLARGAVASAKGEFASREFFGEDGKQGPYRFTDRTGAEDIVVVAGSESIWLNGEPLRRGEEEDYVIDYALGEITFTSRRVITANSEITADYQYSSARYRRRVGFAEVDGPVGGWGRVRAAFFSEGDDADDPFGGDLSDAELASLAAVGDSARVEGGTRYVGPGRGDYQQVVDAESGKEIFVFVEGAGDYEVAFVNVGEGKGEYEPDPLLSTSRTVYVFVGVGNGRFVPRRDLPAPERRRLADLRWEWGGERGAFSVEGAVSDADGNVLSRLDDGDNQGGAVALRGTMHELALGSTITVTPRATVRRVGGGFRSPARLRAGFFARDWNLTGTEEIREEDLLDAGVEIGWTEHLRVSAELARLALADTFTAVRQRRNARWTDSWLEANAGWITTRDEVGPAEGRLDRKSGALTLRRYAVRPRVRALRETRRRAGTGRGERHREWEAALLFPLGALPITAEVGAGRRLDDSLEVAEDAWREIRDARRGFGRIEGRFKDLSVDLRYEARRVTGDASTRERRDTGRLDLRHLAARGAWTAVITADVGTVGLRRRTKLIVEAVSDSAGFYDRFGNYVGPGGGYDVQFGPPGEEILTGQVDLSTRLRWSSPGEEIRVPGLLRKLAWEGFVNLTESSSLPLVNPRYFFSPGSYLDRETTLQGRLDERQILDLFPEHRALGLRLRQEARRRMTQNPQPGGASLVEIQNEDALAAVVRTNPAPGWDAEAELGIGGRREEVDTGSGAFVQETDLRSGALRGGRQFRVAGGRGRASGELTYSEETGEDRRAEGWVVKPRIQWSLLGRGRLDVRYTRTHLTRRSGFVALRGAGAPSLTEGWRLDVVGELRLGEGIAVTTVLGINRPQDLPAVTEGRMEVRGTF